MTKQKEGGPQPAFCPSILLTTTQALLEGANSIFNATDREILHIEAFRHSPTHKIYSKQCIFAITVPRQRGVCFYGQITKTDLRQIPTHSTIHTADFTARFPHKVKQIIFKIILECSIIILGRETSFFYGKHISF